jgi:hypothetical protein
MRHEGFKNKTSGLVFFDLPRSNKIAYENSL